MWYLFFSLGVPVDVLVDIESPNTNRLGQQMKYRENHYGPNEIDDPFDLCSMQEKVNNNNDIGQELGLALEKSIKLHAQVHCQNSLSSSSSSSPSGNSQNLVQLCSTDWSTFAFPRQVSASRYEGLLVNLDESPDKKQLHLSRVQKKKDQQLSKDSELVFNNPSNPFQLAWDVIEQEAQNLADHIQYDKEKSSISPRKSMNRIAPAPLVEIVNHFRRFLVVDLAMWQSPDSPLMSPTKNNVLTEAPFLIKSSPDLEKRSQAKVV